MDDLLRTKANTVFYFLTKEAARMSWIEFLEECDCSKAEWQEIKKEITSKTGIEFNYL